MEIGRKRCDRKAIPDRSVDITGLIAFLFFVMKDWIKAGSPWFEIGMGLVALIIGVYLRSEYLTMVAMRASAQFFGNTQGFQKKIKETEHINKELEIEVAAREDAILNAPNGAVFQHIAVSVNRSQTPGPVKTSDLPAWATAAEAKSLFATVRQGETEREIDGKYGDLFKALDLTPGQLTEFRHLLTTKQEAIVDAADAAYQQGLTLKQAWSAGLSYMATPFDAQIGQLLRPDQFARYYSYQQTIAIRNTVNQLKDSLGGSDNAMTAIQADKMVQLMFGQETPDQLQNQVRLSSVAIDYAPISKREIAGSSSILNSSQIDAFQQLRQQMTLSANLQGMIKQKK